MNIATLLLLIALILFVIASIPDVASRVNLVALGLAFATASQLVGVLG